MTFVSSSITAIFSTKLAEKPEKSGSLGVGFTINRGVKAKAVKEEGVFLNGEKVEFPTVEYVLRKLDGEGISIETELPLSCGFGLSGASALATALEINKAKNLALNLFKLADIAHEAEVVNRTGLGDVLTQVYGGIVVRKKAASPSISKVEKLLSNMRVDFLVLGKIPTKEVLQDELRRERINKAGKRYLKEFLKNPSSEKIFEVSKKFAIETGLADGEIMDVMEAVESMGGKAGMGMLGKTVFAKKGLKAFQEFKGIVFSARIVNCSIRI